MLRFISMTIVNAGPYIGEQTIDFQDGRGVSIIWEENGFGKTTLLNLFRYALFGRFQNRQGATIDIRKMVNSDGELEGNYGIKVILKMVNDGKQYVLTRQFSVREGVTTPTKNDDYVHDTFLNVDGAILPASARDHELAKIMPEDVSRFFLFDGELLQDYENLLDVNSSDSETIKKGIETILGVPILTNGEIDTAAVLSDQQKAQTRVAQANSTTERIATKILSEAALLEAQKAECDEHQAELDRLYDERDALEQDARQNEHVNDLVHRMNTLEADIAEKEARRDALIQSLCMQTKDAWKGMLSKRSDSILADIGRELADLEQKKASQDSVRHILAYMKKAAELGVCDCCGQNVDEAHGDLIRQKIQEWESEFVGLSEEDIARIQQLRVRQTSLQSMHSDSNAAVIKTLEEQLETLIVQIDQVKQQLKETRTELARYGQIEDLSRRDSELTRRLADCLRKIDNSKAAIAETREKIRQYEQSIASLNEKIRRTSTVDNDLALAIRKTELCEHIHAVFEEGVSVYRENLKKKVEKDATELFLTMSSDEDYTALRINDNYGLEIIHRSDRVVPNPSAGFQHIVALSLIGALHKNAPLNGPVIMDSPFGRLSGVHKEKIIKVLPKLAKEVVLLAYYGEIDEQEARRTLGGDLRREYKLEKINSFRTKIIPQ